mmetsp:Transcript_48616/g.141661  ORF Transcript_48616/g.141661 Transcript_48616/m.141661 type:complete len:253 (-) Transcript_48616:3-761(-)
MRESASFSAQAAFCELSFAALAVASASAINALADLPASLESVFDLSMAAAIFSVSRSDFSLRTLATSCTSSVSFRNFVISSCCTSAPENSEPLTLPLKVSSSVWRLPVAVVTAFEASSTSATTVSIVASPPIAFEVSLPLAMSTAATSTMAMAAVMAPLARPASSPTLLALAYLLTITFARPQSGPSINLLPSPSGLVGSLAPRRSNAAPVDVAPAIIAKSCNLAKRGAMVLWDLAGRPARFVWEVRIDQMA